MSSRCELQINASLWSHPTSRCPILVIPNPDRLSARLSYEEPCPVPTTGQGFSEDHANRQTPLTNS